MMEICEEFEEFNERMQLALVAAVGCSLIGGEGRNILE